MRDLFQQKSERALNMLQTAQARAQSMRRVNYFLQAVRAFQEDRCSLIAAALSYYTLLAVFPLLLFILALASPFLQTENAMRVATAFVSGILPEGAALIRNNLQQAIRLRGEITLIAGAGFLWSASGVFSSIQIALNRAFRVQRARPLVRERLVSMAMVFGVSVLFLASFLLTVLMRFLLHMRIMQRQIILSEALPTLGAVILSAIVFAMLYRFIPYDPTIRWRNVAWSAILAAGVWEISKLGFAWYITNYATLNLVYGSLGAVIALMLWGYVTWTILLFGAELAAVSMGARERVRTGKEWWAIVAQE